MPAARSLVTRLAFTLLALTLPASIAAQDAATDRGSLLVAGSAGFSSMSYGSDSGRVSQLTFAPRAQVFVLPGLAVGAALGIERWRQGDAVLRYVAAGPVVTWFMLPEARPVTPYVTASGTYSRRAAENTSGVETGSYLGYRAGAGMLYLVNPHVGLSGEVYYDAVRGRGGRADGIGERETIGLALGLSVFLLGSR